MERRYFFKGSAVGAAANVQSALTARVVVPSLAPASIPEIGGESRNKEENFCFALDGESKRNILAVRRTETCVEGGPHPLGGIISRSDCVVHGYAAFDRVFVDHMKSHLESELRDDEKIPRIYPRGNHLCGLRIDKYLLEVDLDERIYCDCATRAELDARFAEDEALRQADSWRFGAEPDAKCIPAVGEWYVCTLVREIRWSGEKHPDVEIDGYTLWVRGLGRVYLAEILVGDRTRRLTMVRVDLGSGIKPVEGQAMMMARGGDQERGGSSGGSVDSSPAGMP